MEITDKDQLEEAKRFTEHYLDLVDNHRDSLVYYLTDCATFDWFGKTVKGEKSIKTFLKDTVATVEHDFADSRPVSKIGFRDTHIIQFQPVEMRKRPARRLEEVPNDCEKTPPKVTTPILAGSSHEEGQGDGVHNCLSASPTKKIRLDLGDCAISKPKIKYVRAEGFVKFRKKSSKKYQKETTWSRPCKLEIAYSGNESTNFTIHLVIYQGNMRCRRNLLKEFDAVQKSD